MSHKAILIFADSESDADQFFLSRIFVPDRFLSFVWRKKKYGLVNGLEFDRVKKESSLDEVLSLEEWMGKAKKRYRKKQVFIIDVIKLVAETFSIKQFIINPFFPAGLALQLRASKIKLEVAEKGLFPERMIKQKEEIQAIKEANRISTAGIKQAKTILRSSTIKNNKLYYKGKLLTSEGMQEAIAIECLQKGGIAKHTIVAGGEQASYPHHAGSGPLRPNSLIIVDVFPRVIKTGYYGDMTRTFLKGRASEEQRRLVRTVRMAQKKSMDNIKANIFGKKSHEVVEKYFKEKGYENTKSSEGNEGFIHSTGHGLGLDIHEQPSLSPRGERLKAGMVVTVEPGLYYRELGGCRIEDVVSVTKEGYECLSSLDYSWEL